MKKERSPEMRLYEWDILRWLTSRTRAELDPIGRYIYRELLDLCYAQGKMPRDHETLARHAGVSGEDFERCWPRITRHFKVDKHDSESLVNDFATVARKSYFRFVSEQRKKGKNGGRRKSNENSSVPSNGLATAEAAAKPIREDKKYKNTVVQPPNPPLRTDADLPTGQPFREQPNVRQFRNVLDSTVQIPPEYEGFDWEGWVRARWSAHPIPGKGAQFCVALVLERVFKPAPHGFLPSEFERVHGLWLESWRRGDSTPCALETFIVGGWFNKLPPPRAEPATSPRRSRADEFRDAI